MTKKPLLAVSQCLAGDNVRYDGATKRNLFVTDIFSVWFDFLSICPEVEIGLPVPRKPIHLLKKNERIYAVLVENSSVDFTLQLQQHAQERQANLSSVSGYIFKARSPSCGVNTTVLYQYPHDNQKSVNNIDNLCEVTDKLTSGVFSQVVINNNPYLPIIDESSLEDEGKRTQFLESVLSYYNFFQVTPFEKQGGIDQFIIDYGLLWVLRTGKSITALEALSLYEFKVLFFKSINQYYTNDVQITYIEKAIRNNPEIFNQLGQSFSALLDDFLAKKTTVLDFKRQLAGFLGEERSSHYRLFLIPSDIIS